MLPGVGAGGNDRDGLTWALLFDDSRMFFGAAEKLGRQFWPLPVGSVCQNRLGRYLLLRRVTTADRLWRYLL